MSGQTYYISLACSGLRIMDNCLHMCAENSRVLHCIHSQNKYGRSVEPPNCVHL